METKNQTVLIALAAAGLFGIFTVFQSFFIVQPGEGVVVTTLGNSPKEAVFEGVHFKAPFATKTFYYDTTVQKHEVPASSSTKDLQALQAKFAVNFRLDPSKLVELRKTQGTLENLIEKIIAPQTQEAFKTVAASLTAEESVTNRTQLKEAFDDTLSQRLEKYGVVLLDTSVVDIDFSEGFAKAVEEKQIAEQSAQRAVYVAKEAEQSAQAEINKARGSAESQRVQAEALKAAGGELVIQREAISKWDGKLPTYMGGNGVTPFVNVTPTTK